MTEHDLLSGELTLVPGSADPIRCARPMVGAGLMHRLTEGRRAVLLPELLGSVFTLCAHAQRGTSRRAVEAALGIADDPAVRERESLVLALFCVREQLQRLALDLPALRPVDGVNAGWLRDAPVLALPARAELNNAPAFEAIAASLPGWLERRLLGRSIDHWLDRWRADPAGWLTEWGESNSHPLARWLQATRPEAEALTWPCRPLAVLDDAPASMNELSEALEADEHFAERPLWRGAPAETGPWTRQGRMLAGASNAWLRLGARLADVLHLARGDRPQFGGLPLAPGVGIAWTEMSRGLLIHYVRLDGTDPDTARAERYRVLAPTEWNFHPEGELAAALRERRFDLPGARLAAAALDPCIRFEIEAEAEHA